MDKMRSTARLMALLQTRAPGTDVPTSAQDVEARLRMLHTEGYLLVPPDDCHAVYCVRRQELITERRAMAEFIWDMLLSQQRPPEQAPPPAPPEVKKIEPARPGRKRSAAVNPERAPQKKKLPAIKRGLSRTPPMPAEAAEEPCIVVEAPRPEAVPSGYTPLDAHVSVGAAARAECAGSIYLRSVARGPEEVLHQHDEPASSVTEMAIQKEAADCRWRKKVASAKEASRLKRCEDKGGGVTPTEDTKPHRWAAACAKVQRCSPEVRDEVRRFVTSEMLAATVAYAAKLARSFAVGPHPAEGSVFEKLGCRFKVAASSARGPAVTGSRRSYGKVLKQELRGAEVVERSGVAALNVPPSYVLDYLGQRVLVTALCPARSEFVYGSNEVNFGKATPADDMSKQEDPNHPHPVVRTDSALACSAMERVGRVANLAGHWVERLHRRRFLHGPIDMQVHREMDGTLYAVRLRRLLPPCLPEGADTHPSACCPPYLTHRFRPEALEHLSEAVSCDAFSPFGMNRGWLHDKHAQEQACAVQEDCLQRAADAIESLCCDVTWHMPSQDMEPPEASPASAARLQPASPRSASCTPSHAPQQDIRTLVCFCGGIPNVMHAFGLNLRHLGLLAERVDNEAIRSAIFVEITARVIRQLAYFHDDGDTDAALRETGTTAFNYNSISAVVRNTIVTGITRHDPLFAAMSARMFPGCPHFEAASLPEAAVLSAISRVCGLLFQDTSTGQWRYAAKWCDVGDIACCEVVRLRRTLVLPSGARAAIVAAPQTMQAVEAELKAIRRLIQGGTPQASAMWGEDVSLSTIIFIRRHFCGKNDTANHFRYVSSLGKVIGLDTSEEAMAPFRLHHGMVIQFESQACATVLGVAEGKLWRHEDCTMGARPFNGSTFREIMSANPFVWVADTLPMSLRRKPCVPSRRTVLQQDHVVRLGPQGILQRFSSSLPLVRKYGFHIGDRLQYTVGDQRGAATTFLGYFLGVPWVHDDDGRYPVRLHGTCYTSIQEDHGFRVLAPSTELVSHPQGLLQFGTHRLRCGYRVMHKFGVHHSQVCQVPFNNTAGFPARYLGKRCVVIGVEDSFLFVAFQGASSEVVPLELRLASHLTILGTVPLPLDPLAEANAFPYPTLPNGVVGAFDVCCSTCQPFGMYHGQRFKVIRGEHLRQLGTVVGVWHGSLWGHIDGSRGAEVINPSDLIVLAVSVRDVSLMPAAVRKQWRRVQNTLVTPGAKQPGGGGGGCRPAGRLAIAARLGANDTCSMSISGAPSPTNMTDKPANSSDTASQSSQGDEGQSAATEAPAPSALPPHLCRFLSVTGEIVPLDTSFAACQRYGFFFGQLLRVRRDAVRDYPLRHFMCHGGVVRGTATEDCAEEGQTAPGQAQGEQAGHTAQDTVIVVGVTSGELWFAQPQEHATHPLRCKPFAGQTRAAIVDKFNPQVIGIAASVPPFHDGLQHHDSPVFRTMVHASFTLGGTEYHRTVKKENVLIDVTGEGLRQLTDRLELNMIIVREPVCDDDQGDSASKCVRAPVKLDKSTAVRIVGCTDAGMWVHPVVDTAAMGLPTASGKTRAVSLVPQHDVAHWHPYVEANLLKIPVKAEEKTDQSLRQEACTAVFDTMFSLSSLQCSGHVWEYCVVSHATPDDPCPVLPEDTVRWVAFTEWQAVSEAYDSQKVTVRVDEPQLKAVVTIYFPGLLCLQGEGHEYKVRRRKVVSIVDFAAHALLFDAPLREVAPLSLSSREAGARQWHSLLCQKAEEYCRRVPHAPLLMLRTPVELRSAIETVTVPAYTYDRLGDLAYPVVRGVMQVYTTAVLGHSILPAEAALRSVARTMEGYPAACHPTVCAWVLRFHGVLPSSPFLNCRNNFTELAQLWCAHEAATGTCLQVPWIDTFIRFIDNVLWALHHSEARCRRAILRSQKKVRGTMMQAFDKKIAAVVARQANVEAGDWPPIGALLKAGIAEAVEETMVTALSRRDKPDDGEDPHILEDLEWGSHRALPSSTSDWWSKEVRVRVADTLTSHPFVESSGRMITFETGPAVEAQFGYKSGELAEYGAGDLQGRRVLIMGERGGKLWRYDSELDEAHPFAGSTRHEIRTLHNMTVVASRQPLPSCAPFLFLCNGAVRAFHTGPHSALRAYGLQRGARYSFTGPKVPPHLLKLVVCVIGVLHSCVSAEDADVYFATDWSGAFTLECEKFFGSSGIQAHLLYTSDVACYCPNKHSIIVSIVSGKDEPSTPQGLDITQGAFDSLGKLPPGSLSCGSVLLHKGEEVVACGVSVGALYVLHPNQSGAGRLLSTNYSLYPVANRRSRVPLVDVRRHPNKERLLFYYIGTSGAVRVFDRTPVLLRQWGVAADDLILFREGKYKGDEGVVVGLRSNTIWVDLRRQGVAYPVSASPARLQEEHSPSVVGSCKLVSFYG